MVGEKIGIDRSKSARLDDAFIYETAINQTQEIDAVSSAKISARKCDSH